MAAGLTDHVWSVREVLMSRVPPWPQHPGDEGWTISRVVTFSGSGAPVNRDGERHEAVVTPLETGEEAD